MISSEPTIPLLTSIAALADRYDAWLVDVWGVIHNGVSPFARACEACVRYRDRGGTVVLVSNAPRPWSSVAGQLDGLGVPREAWDAIVTSGDVARGMIERVRGRPVFHLGPERDRPLFDGLAVQFADAGTAEVVVCTGLFDDKTETPADYAAMLARFKARGLPLICANPDLVVERGGILVYCAGALGEAYRALGGAVEYAGKPHLPIYQAAFAAIQRLRGGEVARSRMLAIGDGIDTDIKGAATAGIDALFVPSAVSVKREGPLDGADVARLFAAVPFRPVAAQQALAW